MPRRSPLEDCDFWRARAEEARGHAGMMADEPSRKTMLEIAVSYDPLAQRAEERIKRKTPPR